MQSWAERDLSEVVAKSVTGVTSVDNRIEVARLEDRADSEIARDVEQRLHWDVLVDDALIAVASEHGHVTLTGTVGSAAERLRAARAAHVAGVEHVDFADLEVAAWAREDMRRRSQHAVRSPEQIVAAVRAALRRDPRVAAFAIDVTAENDTVTLRGAVDNLKALRCAATDAHNTVGVARVVNRLRVDPGKQRPAEDTHRRCRSRPTTRSRAASTTSCGGARSSPAATSTSPSSTGWSH